MSLDVMKWVLHEACVADHADFRLLIALAERAHSDGTEARPSIRWLAERMQRSERTVQRGLVRLQESGLIRHGDQSKVPDNVPANHRPIVYDIVMVGVTSDVTAERELGVTSRPVGVTPGDAVGVTPDVLQTVPSSLREETKREGRAEREQKPKRPSSPRRCSLPEDFQFDQDALVAQFDLPAALVASELDALRDHAKIEGMRSADWDASARRWIRQAQRYRAKAEDRSPNVSNLYGQGTLFEPGSGDRRRAWLTERVAEREAQEAAASSVPSCEESPEAIRRRILRSLETA